MHERLRSHRGSTLERRRHRRTLKSWPVVILVVLLGTLQLAAGACSDDASLTAPGENNFVVKLTDDHVDDLQAVEVFFVGLTVKPSGEPVRTLDVVLSENPIELLELGREERIVSLATGSVEPGVYQFIRIELDEDRSRVVEGDGTEKAIRLPSEEIKINGPFRVPADADLTVVLDFDAERSLKKLGNGGWLLEPVIVVTRVD